MTGPAPELLDWVAATLGGPVADARRAPGGGSRQTWFVTVETPGGDTEAVLRVEGEGSFTGTDLTLAREATVYRALQDTRVPVARVLGALPDGSAVLLERLHGKGELRPTDAKWRPTLEHFMEVIGELHSLDVRTLDLPGFMIPSAPEDHPRDELDRWQRRAEQGGVQLDPLALYAAAYLHAHPPAMVQRTCLVQADTGPGNFVAQGGRVSGLVDLELAYVGDPMDDIAWILYRAFGPGRSADDPAPYLARYSARSGLAVDAASVAYYAVAVQYRCAIITGLAIQRGGGARGWAPYLLVHERYLAGIADALMALTGIVEPDPPLPTVPPSPRTAWYDHLLEGVRAGVRGIADEALREETRNQQILVQHLRAHDRIGAALDDADRADAIASGLDPDGLDATAEAAGAAGDEAVLRFLLRHGRRRRALWADLLDRPPR